MFSIMVGHFNYKHRCLIEKNVPIAVILPSRWWDGADKSRDGAHQLSMIVPRCMAQK